MFRGLHGTLSGCGPDSRVPFSTSRTSRHYAEARRRHTLGQQPPLQHVLQKCGHRTTRTDVTTGAARWLHLAWLFTFLFAPELRIRWENAGSGNARMHPLAEPSRADQLPRSGFKAFSFLQLAGQPFPCRCSMSTATASISSLSYLSCDVARARLWNRSCRAEKPSRRALHLARRWAAGDAGVDSSCSRCWERHGARPDPAPAGSSSRCVTSELVWSAPGRSLLWANRTAMRST